MSELLQGSSSVASTHMATAREYATSKLWPCVNPRCEHYQIPSESVRLLKTFRQKLYESGSHYENISRLTWECGYLWAVTQHNVSKGAQDRIKIIDYGEPWRDELRRLWDDRSYFEGNNCAHFGSSTTPVRRLSR